MASTDSATTTWPAMHERQAWLAVLARASVYDLEHACTALTQPPAFRFLRPPETGLTQVRARAGGTGQQFNLGEATVTRCTVQLESGAIGVGYVMGRDGRRAQWVAVFDALLQDPVLGPPLQRQVIAPLAQAQAEHQQRQTEATATTKVDFFTMVRGDD
ncbi:MAG: hypothetical protein ETSY1_27705 [Candidatus Entotheonella factor]|uniref:Phosphonate C-P lyase system protein PhnG n=1 Tax=Entotheonella factor TaxID=1429438 RepID=W4LDT0_ENTF1|nr:MAG: hypothetical protein ETSY1_27705 [Candidatus Entotheonella factor]